MSARRYADCPGCGRVVEVRPSIRQGVYVVKLHKNPTGRVCFDAAGIHASDTEEIAQ